MSEASSCIRWLLLDASFKYVCLFVCLFNFVNSLSLSGLLLFFAFFVVGTVGIVDPLLSLYSIYFAVFSLDSLKIR